MVLSNPWVELANVLQISFTQCDTTILIMTSHVASHKRGNVSKICLEQFLGRNFNDIKHNGDGGRFINNNNYSKGLCFSKVIYRTRSLKYSVVNKIKFRIKTGSQKLSKRNDKKQKASSLLFRCIEMYIRSF